MGDEYGIDTGVLEYPEELLRELRIAVADQEAVGKEEAVNGIGQVPRDLCHERLIRVRSRAGDVDSASLQVDQEERVVGDQASRPRS